jgi:hypothetical protein
LVAGPKYESPLKLACRTAVILDMSDDGPMCVSIDEIEARNPDADHCQEVRAEVEAARRRSVVRKIGQGIAPGGGWVYGAVALMVGLSIVAVIPVLQFMSLGYMLEAGGRVARTGRLRDGFIGVRQAARVGSVVLGIWLVLLPVRLVSSLAQSAQLIDPEGLGARRWQMGVSVLTILAGLHVVAACSRGGKLRHFLWPFTNPIWLVRRLRQGGYYAEARDAVWDFAVALRLPYYFWLGLRGFVGTMVWLVIPITLLALGRKAPALGFAGALGLGVVVLYLPFIQMRFAVANRMRALFQPGAVREGFRRAPWAYAGALIVTLAFAVPLYLLKIEIVPREAAWLPSLFFIAFIFPARLLTGWAYGRSQRHATRRHWLWRVTGRLWMVPVAAAYVVIVYFSQYAAWEGIWSLYEQHAFLLPVPFVGL